jgi:hypothetical protein
MNGMASVSFDQEILFIGKNANIIIIIIHSIAGGWDGGQHRPEILSFKVGKWTELGQLDIGRFESSATKIMVNSTVCG